MFVFQKIWRALFSCNTGFEIRLFALLPTSCYYFRAEQELLLRRSATYADDRLKGRKSLFRRSKKSSSGYTINHSRESSDSKPGDIDMSTSMTSSSSFVFTTGMERSYVVLF